MRGGDSIQEDSSGFMRSWSAQPAFSSFVLKHHGVAFGAIMARFVALTMRQSLNSI